MSTLQSLASIAAAHALPDEPFHDEDENARPPRPVRLVARDEDYDAAAERWLEEENP